MRCSKSSGYPAYPLLALLSLALFLTGTLPGRAQTSDPQQGSSPAQNAAPPSDSQPTTLTPSVPAQGGESAPPAAEPGQAEPQPGTSTSRPGMLSEQERIRLAQQAQARVQRRRAERTAAIAQETYSHRWEAYFGYSYLRVRPGHFLQHANESGWNAGVTRLFSPKWGISIDTRGYYKSVYVGNNQYGLFQPFVSNYAVMAGGQYWLRQRKNYAVSLQGLAGVTRTIFNANSVGMPGTYVGLYPNQTRFTAAAVMPWDFNLSPNLAVRIAPTYNPTTWGGDVQHNLGFSGGLTYRWGHQ